MSLSGRRILVVEDDPMVACLLLDFLKRLGCASIGPAASTDVALTLLAREPVEAALLDLNLRGLKSYPVAEALAARGIPFVFLTGDDQVPPPHAARPMVQKPFDRDHLTRTLAALFDA